MGAEAVHSINKVVACDYANFGIPVFPADDSLHKKHDDRPDKGPIESGDWKKVATTDKAEIRRWFAKHPTALVGLPCGPANILVIDLDIRDGKVGVENFDALERKHGKITGAVRVRTLSGGTHIIFKQPSNVSIGNSIGDLPAGIDVRGAGGYIIAPGTVWSRTGEGWSVEDGSEQLFDAIHNDTLAEPPQWLIDLLLRKSERPLSERAKSVSRQPSSSDDFDAEIRYLENALRYIPSDDRDVWLRVGGALHDSGHVWAREMWDDWSRQSAKFDAKDQNNTWKSYSRSTGERAGIGSIIDMARDNGFNGQKYERRLLRADADRYPVKGSTMSLPDTVSALPRRDEDIEWPSISSLGSSLLPVMPFDLGMMPEAMRDYIGDISDRQQSPVDIPGVTAIIAYGSLAGCNIRVHPKANDREWSIAPNLWGMCIGSPSMLKSPAQYPIMKPIEDIEKDAVIENEEIIRQKQISDAIIKEERETTIKVARERMRKSVGNNQQEYDAARALLEKLPPEPTVDPIPARLMVTTSTPEKLGMILKDNPLGLLVFQDELKMLFATLNKAEGQAARGFYLSAYNASGVHTVDTIKHGTIRLVDPCLSIMGNIHPELARSLVHSATSYGGNDDGFMQRFQLAIQPDKTPDWRFVDRQVNTAAKNRYHQCFADLYEYRNSVRDRVHYNFSQEAQERFNAWYSGMMLEARNCIFSPSLEEHFIKSPTAIAPIALLHQLADGDKTRGIIELSALEAALKWADYLKSHALRIYDCADPQTAQGAQLIVERRHSLSGRFTAYEIASKDWRGLSDARKVNSALELLTAHGFIRGESSRYREAGGRPTIYFSWNPSLEDFLNREAE